MWTLILLVFCNKKGEFRHATAPACHRAVSICSVCERNFTLIELDELGQKANLSLYLELNQTAVCASKCEEGGAKASITGQGYHRRAMVTKEIFVKR